MDSAVQTISDNSKPARSMLCDQSQITGIPTQRGRAVRLMARKLWKDTDAAVSKRAKLNGLAAALLGDHGQVCPATA